MSSVAQATPKASLPEQPLLPAPFHAAFNRFHGNFTARGPLAYNLFRHRFRGRNQLRRLVDMIHNSDTLPSSAVNHFAGKAKFVRHTLAHSSASRCDPP